MTDEKKKPTLYTTGAWKYFLAQALGRKALAREDLEQRLEQDLTGIPESHISATIDQALHGLLFRERNVLLLRYGLGDEENNGYTWTLEQVGRLFRVTRERVRAFETKGMQRLQGRITLEDGGNGYALVYKGKN